MFLFFIIVFITHAIFESNCIIVNTKQGSLKGSIEKSRGGRNFYSFYGVPYAQPPVGDLRFEDPEPPSPWIGVRDATILTPPCLNLEFPNPIIGNEDCLYLNLYVPEAGYTQKYLNKSLPVIVFIFGGRFMYCHVLPSRYGPHYFMDKDVILITFHYRIGALGFLSTEDASLPGNYGLKDFVAVLKWVQENIENFNGDKNSVTIMGGSSGGWTALSAIISPLTQGLFHQCLTQSGFPNDSSDSKPGAARKTAHILATKLGCNDTHSSDDLVSCLKKVDAEDLVEQTVLAGINFDPVIEDETVPGAFLIDDPMKLLSRQSNIPLLFGINSNEGGMNAIFQYYLNDSEQVSEGIEKLADDFTQTIHEFLYPSKITNDPIKQKCVAEMIRNRFFGDSDIKENALGFAELITVMNYVQPFRKLMEIYRGPKYAYYYDHRNEPNFDHYYGNPPVEMGVIHGDELISMFNWSEFIPPVTQGADFEVSEKVLDLWTNFVISGNPNGDSNEQIWKPVTSLKHHYLHIKKGVFEMTDDILQDDLKFLDSLDSCNTDIFD